MTTWDEKVARVARRYMRRHGSFTIEYNQVSDNDLRVLYIPSGDADWHYSGTTNKGTAATASSTSTLTLSSGPLVGSIGRRLNEYGGAILRTFPSTGVIEERVVENTIFSASNWVTNLRKNI